MAFVDRPQAVGLRRLFFQVHLWAGVVVGLYLVAMSLSGSTLVFRRELLDDRPSLPAAVQPVPLPSYQALVDLALGAHAGAVFDSIDMRASDRRMVLVCLVEQGKDRIVYVDRWRTRIVADVVLQDAHPVVMFLAAFHDKLLTGGRAKLVTGTAAATLLVLSLTGVVLWWPGRARWRQALRVRWRAGWQRVNWDLHSAFGFWALAFFVMWGATGTYFIFPGPLTRLLSPPAATTSRPSSWQPGDPVLSADAYVDKGTALHRGSDLAYLDMGVCRPHRVVRAFLSPRPGASLNLAKDVVTFHPATLDVLSDDSSSRWTSGQRVLSFLYSLHFGDFGGLPLKLVWASAGPLLALLTVTGYLMWWNRVLVKKWRALRRRRAAASAR